MFDRLARSNPPAKSQKNHIIDGNFTQPVSKADLKQRMLDVRFPLNSRHSPRRRLRQLCANFGSRISTFVGSRLPRQEPRRRECAASTVVFFDARLLCFVSIYTKSLPCGSPLWIRREHAGLSVTDRRRGRSIMTLRFLILTPHFSTNVRTYDQRCTGSRSFCLCAISSSVSLAS